MILNELSKQAISAAMRGGTHGWSSIGSAHKNVKYFEPLQKKSKKMCYCGCFSRATHLGMANGVCLISGCIFYVMKWLKS